MDPSSRAGQAPGDPTPYQVAQRSGQEALRRTLLDAASRLLLAEGPGALTMRRVAGAVGCSTTVLYTMFGGKEGLADALYREGFERLRRRLEAVAGDDPLGRLAALGHAYRANALAERAYYGVMFQQAIPGFRPSAASLAAAGASLEVLARAVRAAMDAGALRPGDPQTRRRGAVGGRPRRGQPGVGRALPRPRDRGRPLPLPGLGRHPPLPLRLGGADMSDASKQLAGILFVLIPRSSSAAGRCCA